jgi:hypothetical protein
MFSLLVASVLVLTAFAEAHALPMTGDCNDDGEVTVDELILCVGIGLDQTPLARCTALDENADDVVTVAELVQAVHAAIRSTITANGVCLMPGLSGTPPPGLVPCNAGMMVQVSSCGTQDRARCLNDPSALVVLDFGSITAGGQFSLRLDETEAMNSLLVFEAQVDEQTTYRVLNFGLLGTGSGRGAGTAIQLQVLINPISEAAVQLLDESGLESFDDEGAAAVMAAVEQANADTDFAGLAAAAAVIAALDTARNDPLVQETLTARTTPTPTSLESATSTATSTRTPSTTPSVTATPTNGPLPTCTPGSAPGSIVIVENLEVTSGHDPILSLTSVSNSFKDGYCFYASDGCALVDFFFGLPRQGSVEWQASQGGTTFSNEGTPLPIPPIAEIPFTGELVCLELDAAGSPIPVNGLRAAVSIDGQCRLGATSLEGTFDNNGDTTLILGGSPGISEYDPCPQSIDPSRIETCWSQSMFTFDCN